MKSIPYRSNFLWIFLFFKLITASQAEILSGRVYEGEYLTEPPTAQGLSDVSLKLYGSYSSGVLGDEISSYTTGSDGWYGLETEQNYEFFSIVCEGKSGYTFQGSSSVSGSASGEEIEYVIPLEGKTLTGNKFWYISDTPQNNPPVASDDLAVTPQDTAVDIYVLSNDTDPDGDPLQINSATDPPHGTTVNHGSHVTYTPDPGFVGVDTFDYTVGDGKGGTDTGEVTVTVQEGPGPGNNPPVADADGPYTGQVGQSITLDGSGSYDPDPGDSIVSYEWDLDSDGQYDDATGVNTTWTWAAVGMYTVDLKVTDSYGESDTDASTVDIQEGVPQDGMGTLDGYKRDADTEEGLEGWRIFIDINGNGQWDEGEPYDMTDGNGYYRIDEVEPGTYRACEQMQDGWEPEEGGSACVEAVDIIAGIITTLDFHNQRTEGTEPGTGLIRGMKFEDLNGNGQRNPNEPGLSDWEIRLKDSENNVLAITITDQNGEYQFDNLEPGTYGVSEEEKEGWFQTFPPEKHYSSVMLSQGEVLMDLDFGNRRTEEGGNSIRGMKYNDLNGNGQKDPNEPGLAGWTIFLDSNDNGRYDEGEPQTTTDTNGNYSFTELEAGVYRIHEVNQSGWRQTDPAVDGMPGYWMIDLEEGQEVTEIDFGNIRYEIPDLCEYDVSGVKYNDLNGNGYRDLQSESGLAGWRIYQDLNNNGIWDEGEPNGVTDADGRYGFRIEQASSLEEIPPIREVLLAGWVQTEPGAPLYAYHDLSWCQQIWPEPACYAVNFGNTEEGTPLEGDWDFGDAPDPKFPTLLASNGARHRIDPDVYLGSGVDADPDGQPILNALGDDIDGNDDEDGVAMSNLNPGNMDHYQVTASTEGLLNVWIDFNRNGRWTDAGEHIFVDTALAAGMNNLSYLTPANAQAGATFARFRFSTQSGLDITGEASDGEVEDYSLEINQGSQLGNITVIKAATPPDSGIVFNFTGDLGSFSLSPASNKKDFKNLPVGNYTITESIPSGWALGNYQISGDLDGGTTHDSSEARYTIDLDAGENISIVIYNYKLGTIILEKQTIPSGAPDVFTFTGGVTGSIKDSEQIVVADLEPGQYIVQEGILSGWTLTDITLSDLNSSANISTRTATINLEAGETVNVMFKNSKEGEGQVPGGVGDLVWNDLNRNGIQDTGEPGIANVWVDVWDQSGNPWMGTATDAFGHYSILNLPPGNYYLVFTLPSGYAFTSMSQGNDPTKDSDANPMGSTNFFTVVEGVYNQDIDAGMYQTDETGEVRGVKWNDLNGNRVRDVGEPGLANWQIILDYDQDGVLDSSAFSQDLIVTTNANGEYKFVNIFLGSYRVGEILQNGWQQTFPDTILGSNIGNIAPYVHSVTLSPGQIVTDIDFGNRREGDEYEWDFGDAPDSYKTYHNSGGPYHDVAEVMMGNSVDSEQDGQPGPLANADNDDGVFFPLPLVVNQFATVVVNVNSPLGVPSAIAGWIDFDQSGTFEDPAERIASGIYIGAGVPVSWTETFIVPPAALFGPTYARFRIYRTEPGVDVLPSPIGYGEEGEVEDYRIEIKPEGDTPQSGHLITGIKFYDLDGDGAWEPGNGESGLPNWTIWLDSDNDGTPDQITQTNSQGNFEFSGVSAGTYTVGEVLQSGWIQTSPPAPGTFTFTIPGGPLPTVHFMMFGNRQSDLPTGQMDFGDAPDPTYPTRLATNGARHLISQNLYLGSSVDSELNGLPSVFADGDDNNSSNDEDGVTFPSIITAGQSISISVTASAAGALNAWIDFNVDGDWADPGEYIIAAQPVVAGTNVFTLNVPANVVTGQSFARFRLSSVRNLSYDGQAPDGEVEDYAVGIQEQGTGSITIIKDAIPEDDTPFWISVVYGFMGGAAPYRDPSSNTSSVTNGPTGIYYIGESVTSGWILKDIVVTGDMDNGSIINVNKGTVDADLDDGENITVVFKNEKVGISGEYDFGDAPDPTYPTLLANNGARHLIDSTLYLGSTIDSESDGLTSILADGDDQDSSSDEDGVILSPFIAPGQTVPITVVASGAGTVNAWLDFNINGDWGDAGEHIIAAQPVVAGTNTFHITVPTNAGLGLSFARFRLSSDRNLSYTGEAPNGEVEDYAIEIKSPEDGSVTIVKEAIPSDDTQFMFCIQQSSGFFNLLCTHLQDPSANRWILLNPGNLQNVYESITPGWTLSDIQITGDTDNGSIINLSGYRVAVDFDPGENIVITFINEKLDEGKYDFGDAPDPNYPTLRASNGANHVIVPGFFLGGSIDPDADGQPTPDARGDDYDGSDDEDGVIFITPIMSGQLSEVEVFVPSAGYLDAWIDFDADWSWTQTSDQIFISEVVSAGSNILNFQVPANIAINIDTYARFRFSTAGGLDPDGPAQDGEVEDYHILLGEEGPGVPGEEEMPYVKWSQPLIEIDPNTDALPVFCGWNEPARSTEQSGQSRQWRMDADDFRCIGTIPVTRIRWWGGYKAWTQFEPPELQPEAWHIGFWANQVEGVTKEDSYPERMVWSLEVPVDRVHFEPVGLNELPQKTSEMCFVYEVPLEPEEWFHQAEFVSNDSIFWITITAVYPTDVQQVNMWGWMTRPHIWGNGSVSPTIMGEWPTYDERLFPGRIYSIENSNLCGQNRAYDLCFELLTEQPWIKFDKPFTGIREWPYYADEISMALEPVEGEVLMLQQVADDWFCECPDPVTAIAWNGSYIGYGYEPCECDEVPELHKPDYFLLSIWSDSSSIDTEPIYYPCEKIWEYSAYDYDEVMVGYDRNPEGEPNEPVFRYCVRLPEEAWFHQETPRSIYWFSVVAVYRGSTDEIPYSWGWTNNSYTFGSPALSTDSGSEITSQWQQQLDSTGQLVDMSFTLLTTLEQKSPTGQVYYSKSSGERLTFEPGAIIDGNSEESFAQVNPAITVEDQGIIHVVWEDYRMNPSLANIMYAKSKDGGISFEESVMVDDEFTVSTHQAKPKIAVDNDGIIHVVWEDYRRDSRLGDIYYAKSTDGGVTFGNDVCVDDLITLTSRQINPVIAVDNEGIIHVAWEDYRDNAELGDIYYAKSIDGGQTFSNDIIVNDVFQDFTHQCKPAIALSPDDIVYIVWEDYRNSPSLGDIYCVRSIDGGESFEDNIMVEDPITITHNQINPTMAVDDQGIIYIVWEDYRDNLEFGNIYCSQSLDNGITFEKDIMVDEIFTITTHQANPDIAATGDGFVYIVWEDYRDHSENASIYYSESLDGGKTFGEDLIVNIPVPGERSQLNPAIVVDNLGVVHLTWQE